jgi:choline dehydrogenase-like flavoprotein
VRAEREIILACGAINSPQLLMLSGIGAPDDLAAHGIAVQVALPGVGKNLQDHVAASVTYGRRGTSPLVHNLRLDRIACSLIQAQFFGTGFAADVPSRWLAFVKTEPALPLPDIQLLFRAGSAEARPYLPPFTAPVADQFSCRAVLLRPESRGTVALASADPRSPPRIDFAILESPKDMRTLRSALRLVRALGHSPSLSPFLVHEVAPGTDKTWDADLDAYIRHTAQFADHAAGTCKMGPHRDPSAVVDPQLRVHGVNGLRVVDASVMPDLVGGNIMACTLMIAEKASDLINAQA